MFISLPLFTSLPYIFSFILTTKEGALCAAAQTFFRLSPLLPPKHHQRQQRLPLPTNTANRALVQNPRYATLCTLCLLEGLRMRVQNSGSNSDVFAERASHAAPAKKAKSNKNIYIIDVFAPPTPLTTTASSGSPSKAWFLYPVLFEAEKHHHQPAYVAYCAKA